MMPIYVFNCDSCRYQVEEIRRMLDYRRPRCACGRLMDYSVSTPNLAIWNAERSFPNVSHTGDGSMTFSSKAAYESHLTANNMAECAHDGKVRPPGRKVKVYG